MDIFETFETRLKQNPRTIVFTEGTDPRIQRGQPAACQRHAECHPAFGSCGRGEGCC